ncbi:hypothetical protein QOZ80_5BG0442360 [Eleusine coracana subsp. coracana]|nr:hypothetical protein QOZ80_5BG0442360 [Eleusine coracana subsp. coracana]
MAPTVTAPRPHAVIVPYPCSGNINPALQLARLLHHEGVHVTFVNTEHNQRRMEEAATANGNNGAGGGSSSSSFRFETIPDGLSDAERAAQDYGMGLSVATSTRCAAPLRDLVARLNATHGVPPVTCVVPTFLMSFVLDVAKELGIPSMVMWGCSAGALVGHTELRELREKGYIPIKEARELETVIDWIPGLPPMPLGDFSGFLRNLDDPDNFGLRFNETETTNCAKADAVLLNTYEALEPDALAALRAEYPRVYTVGPLGSLLRHNQPPQPGPDANNNSALMMSLWRKDDARCLAWLDAHEPGSVVYVSFGSHAVLTPAQAAELAWGLADAGHPFLWAAREDLITGLTKQQQQPTTVNGGDEAGLLAAVLPPEFFESTGPGGLRRCLITTWCAQEEVLRHAAVGCFVTHAGWNSACEGVAAGVPMLCWPGFADQYTNARLACHVWGVGARLLLDGCGGDLTREEVAKRVREVMRAKEMGERAKEWKDMAEEAASPGGTSYDNLKSVVKAMVNDSTSVVPVPADDDQLPANN